MVHDDNYQGSYYGDLSEIEPKYKVHYFMLEEHIKKIITREKLKFIKELETMMYDFKKTVAFTLEKTHDSIAELSAVMSHHRKYIDSALALNHLEKPKEEAFKYKPKKKAKKPVEPIDKDDLEEDELEDF